MSRLPLALVVAAAVVAMPGAADAKAPAIPKPRVKVHLPAPGHITVGALSITHRRRAHEKAPRRIRLRFRRSASLPASVRVLTATRVTRTRRKVAYSLVWLAINRKAPAPARQTTSRAQALGSAQGNDRHDVLGLILTWVAFTSGGQKATDVLIGGIESYIGDGHEVRNADVATPTTLAPVLKDVKGALAPGGQPVIEDAATAYYDDGHAFGWKAAGVAAVFNDLGAATKQGFDDLVKQVEEDIDVDIDGDSIVGGPGCTAGAYQSTPMQITTPAPGETAFYSFETPIPSGGYQKGHGLRGGCDLDARSLQANIELHGGDGSLIAWSYDYEPYPATPDGPRASHADNYCPRTDTDESGQPQTDNHCRLGSPTLGIPPPSQGYLESSWRQDASQYPKHWIIFGVQGSHAADVDRGTPGTVYATITWRPTP